jgi:hypothetical protein
MANVSSYVFDNMTRLDSDNCCIEQNTIQSVNSCNYMLQNYFANDCSMKNPILLATSQPCINYTGGYNVGAGGCNIDDNSKLTIGTIQTNPKARIDLFQRPFATVPYLGRGSVDPSIESQIQQGEFSDNRRSVINSSEKSYIQYSNTPLQPNIKDKMTNTAYMIESEASDGWVRGGLPTRELTRDTENYSSSSCYNKKINSKGQVHPLYKSSI